MHPIAIIDLISVLVLVVAGVLVVSGWRRPRLAAEIPTVFLLLIGLMSLYAGTLFLEWSGFLPYVNWHFLEGIVGVSVPLIWAFTFYVINKSEIVEELRTSRKHFRDLIESTSDWIWEVDTAGHFTYVSPRVERILGYEPKELIGKRPFDLMPPEEAVRVLRLFSKAVDKRTSFQHLENLNLHKDGREIFLETNAVPIFDEKGELKGYRGIDRDITDRKKAEAQTVRQQAQLDAVFRSSPVGIGLVREHKLIRGNQKLFEIIGSDESELVGKDARFLHPDDKQSVEIEKYYEEAVTKGSVRFEVQWQRKDGSIVDLVQFLSPLNPEDVKAGFTVILQDITERKAARLQVLEEKTRAQLYLEVAGVMIVVLDTTARVQLLNRKACEILGCQAEEAIGKDWFSEFMPSSYREITRNVFNRITKDREKSLEYFENPILSSDGTERLIAWHNKLLFDESGAVTGVISSGEDITQTRAAETKTRQIDEQLRVALSAANMGTWRWEAATGKDTLDVSLKTLLGLTADESIEDVDFFDYAHPDDRDAAKNEFDRAICEHDIYLARYRIIRSDDGQIRWVLDQGMPFYDFNGKLEYVSGVVVDITERQNALIALKESEQRFQAAANYTYDWETWVNPEGKTEWINPAVERMSGYTVEECMQMEDYPLPIVYEEDRDLVSGMIKEALEGSTGNDRWFRVKRKDGSICWVAVSWQPIYDQQGKSLGYRTSIRDITERKQAEEEIRQSRDSLQLEIERFENMFHTIPDPIYMKDLDSRFIHVNETFLKHAGFANEQDVIGKTDFDIYEEKHARTFYEDEQEIMRTAIPKIGYEEEGLLLNGRVTYHLSTKMPLRDVDGKVIGLIGVSHDITKRKQAEEEIQQSRDSLKREMELFENMFQTIPDKLYTKDLESRFIHVNQAFIKDSDIMNEQELLGKTDFDIFTEEHARPAYEDEQEIMRTGIPKIGYEEKETWPDGHITWCLSTKMPLRDIQGDIIGLIGISHDITALKMVEERLRQSRQRYRNFIKLCAEGIARFEFREPMSIKLPFDQQIDWIGENGILAECNDVFAHMYEYKDSADFIGSRFYDRWGNKDVAAKVIGRLINDGYQWTNMETCEITHGGVEKYFLNNLVSIIEDDHLVSLWLTQIDVTEQVDYRRRLQFTQFAVDHAGETAFWMRSDGSLYYVNNTACQSLGYTRDELLAMTIFDIDPDFGPEQWADAWEHASTHGTYWTETHHKTKDGRIFPVEINGNYVVYAGQEYCCAFARDISERELAERQRRIMNERLAAQNDELQSIVFTTAHDLRCPLVNITGFTGELNKALEGLRELLKGQKLTPDAVAEIDRLFRADISEALSFIKYGTSTSEQLLDGLLRLSRIGTTELEIQPVNMNEVLKNVHRNLQYEITSLNADISIQPDLPDCRGDKMMLMQIFTNLLENSLKYSDPDRPLIIEVSGTVTADYVEYKVIDNGTGIDSKDAGKVFELFHRLRTDVQGNGLGLTIVRRILDFLDGVVSIDSTPGLGTTVSVRVPKA